MCKGFRGYCRGLRFRGSGVRVRSQHPGRHRALNGLRVSGLRCFLRLARNDTFGGMPKSVDSTCFGLFGSFGLLLAEVATVPLMKPKTLNPESLTP